MKKIHNFFNNCNTNLILHLKSVEFFTPYYAWLLKNFDDLFYFIFLDEKNSYILDKLRSKNVDFCTLFHTCFFDFFQID